MRNGNTPEEPLKKEPRQKVKTKQNKQATVLKQLNNQSLYPLQERIGIYVIAVLSTIGLVLISYTGVMALVSSATNEPDTSIDINVDDVYNILGDLSDESEDEEPTQNPSDLHQYVDPDDESDVPETDDVDDTEPESDSHADIGIVNANLVTLRREPASSDVMQLLHEDYEVRIIDLNYNAYWSHVETIPLDGEPPLQGFVQTEFIDVD